MTYERFEDLPVWKDAATLYERIEDLIEDRAFQASRGFRDQLDRAALSVSNNIAEGFERGTTNELLAFLYIARGSAGEVRSMLTVKSRRISDEDLKSRVSKLQSLAEACSRQLRAWADHLQNSEIKGPRHLTEKSRRIDDQKNRAENFQRQLREKFPLDGKSQS
jgi:four helix bundle protein